MNSFDVFFLRVSRYLNHTELTKGDTKLYAILMVQLYDPIAPIVLISCQSKKKWDLSGYILLNLWRLSSINKKVCFCLPFSNHGSGNSCIVNIEMLDLDLLLIYRLIKIFIWYLVSSDNPWTANQKPVNFVLNQWENRKISISKIKRLHWSDSAQKNPL